MELRKRSSQAMGELSMPDGPEQEGRDNELSSSIPCERVCGLVDGSIVSELAVGI